MAKKTRNLLTQQSKGVKVQFPMENYEAVQAR